MRRLVFGLVIAALALAPVARASAEEADDRAAAQEIARNMKESGLLKDYRVGVKFQGGVAWLMGTVTSGEQKVIAEEIARQSAGVNQIVSKLEVEGSTADLDATIAPAVHADALPQHRALPQQQALPQQRTLPPAPRQRTAAPQNNMPLPYAAAGQPGRQQAPIGPQQAPIQAAGYGQYAGPGAGGMQPMPMAMSQRAMPGARPVSYDNPSMPDYAWPSYAANPNYAALTYPQQYSPTAWPYIGPFYPYPQVPLGWRKVTLEWDDGWWFLDFKDCKDCY